MKWNREKSMIVAIVVVSAIGFAVIGWIYFEVVYGINTAQHQGENVLAGNVTLMKNSSSLPAGWANFTINISRPSSGLVPEKVRILIYKSYWWEWGEIVPNYTKDKPKIGEWTYIDLNRDDRISSGDELVVHARDFKGIYTNYILSIAYAGFKGYMNCPISLGKTQGSVKLVSDEHDLHAGWINLTLFLNNPKHLKVQDIFVGTLPARLECVVAPTPANYTTGTPRDREWTYLDRDSSGDISSGDEIIFLFKNLSHGGYEYPSNTEVIISLYYFEGPLMITPSLGNLSGELRLDLNNSNVDKGWLNFTLILDNPEYLEPQYIRLYYYYGGEIWMNYSQRIAGNNQWNYTDMNGDGKLDDGDRITIYSMAFVESERYNPEIFYDFYFGSISIY